MTDLARVSHGVWREPSDIVDLAGRAAALLTGIAPGSVVSGLSAARLHGLWLPSSEHVGPVEFITHPGAEQPRAHAHSERSEVRLRRCRLRRDEIVNVDGLDVTCIERTWIDIAERLTLLDVVAAGDSALRGGAGTDSLADAVGRGRGRRGVRAARAALTLLDARSRSRPESHLRAGFVLRGLVPSGVNQPVFDDLGQWLAEPDLSFDDARLAVEYNGADHATTDRMRRDMTRQVDLGDRGGWQTVAFGPAQVFGRLDQCAAYVARVRRERIGVRI